MDIDALCPDGRCSERLDHGLPRRQGTAKTALMDLLFMLFLHLWGSEVYFGRNITFERVHGSRGWALLIFNTLCPHIPLGFLGFFVTRIK